MKLSPRTDAAIKICLYLGVHSARNVVRGELAHALDISESEVSRVMADLTKWNVIDPRRGRRGGFRLNSSLENIPVAQMIALGEDSVGWEFTECDRRADCNCIMAGECALNAMFDQFKDHFMALAGQWSLQDLLSEHVTKNAQQKAQEWADSSQP